MNELKDTIKSYRQKKNITKSELSRLINVSPAYITRLENGTKTNPSLEVLTKISNVLEIPLEMLATSKTIKNNKFDLFQILEEKELQKQKILNNSENSSTKITGHFTISDMLLSAFINGLYIEKPYDKKILDIKKKFDNHETLSDEDMKIINDNKVRKKIENDFDINADIGLMDYEKESYKLFTDLLTSLGYDTSVSTYYLYKKIKAQIELEIYMNEFKKNVEGE